MKQARVARPRMQRRCGKEMVCADRVLLKTAASLNVGKVWRLRGPSPDGDLVAKLKRNNSQAKALGSGVPTPARGSQHRCASLCVAKVFSSASECVVLGLVSFEKPVRKNRWGMIRTFAQGRVLPEGRQVTSNAASRRPRRANRAHTSQVLGQRATVAPLRPVCRRVRAANEPARTRTWSQPAAVNAAGSRSASPSRVPSARLAAIRSMSATNKSVVSSSLCRLSMYVIRSPSRSAIRAARVISRNSTPRTTKAVSVPSAEWYAERIRPVKARRNRATRPFPRVKKP